MCYTWLRNVIVVLAVLFHKRANAATTAAAATTSANSAPEILSLPASIDISEDTTTTMLLHTLVTNDTDGDDVTCSIFSTTPSGGPFFMKITGPTPIEYAIHLNSFPDLNYTAASLYEISITCYDTYGASDTDTFYVYIVVNGMPVILNLQNSTTIATTETVGSTVFTVLTNDTEGDSLSFGLSCTNTVSCPFTIYSSGVILLSSSLVGSSEYVYELDITATDGYHATDAHRLTVYVSGINTAPSFLNLPSTIQVAEDTASSASLFTFSIYDSDGDSSFTISATYNPTTGASLFSIDNNTRIISLASGESLDYETTTEYVVNVTANDGTDTSSPAVLTIQVTDINERPVLLKEQYSVVQNEGTAGTSFGAPTMEATDPDTGDTLTYSLDSSSNSSCSYISVNSTTGIMKYDADYDVDDTGLGQSFYCFIKVEDTGGLSVTATVTVFIEDINDNNPAFVSNSYVFTVSQTASVGTAIGTVAATDDDRSTTFSDLTFTLDQSSLSQPYFAVSNAGVVSLAASVASVDAGTTFTSTIYVKNTGYSNTDSASLHITVIASDNDDDFWDDGANVAWVTLAILGGLALLGTGAYLAWKFWHTQRPGPRFVRVKPTNAPDTKPIQKPAAKPAHAARNPSPPPRRTVTPSDVNLNSNYKWEAWNNGDIWI